MKNSQELCVGEAERSLIKEIRNAFPERRPHRFDPMVTSTQSDEPFDTERAFSDKQTWTELDGEWVDQAADGWASALTFLSHEAVCFYLPAYLVADLRGQLKTSDPVFNLTYGFTIGTRHAPVRGRAGRTWRDYSVERWCNLTDSQVLAVIHYLEWRRVNDEFNLDYGIEEALSNYWYVR